jgi:hypothetical protein
LRPVLVLTAFLPLSHYYYRSETYLENKKKNIRNIFIAYSRPDDPGTTTFVCVMLDFLIRAFFQRVLRNMRQILHTSSILGLWWIPRVCFGRASHFIVG